MDAVVEGYFDESHRQLQKQKKEKKKGADDGIDTLNMDDNTKLPPIHNGGSSGSAQVPPGMMTNDSFDLSQQPYAKMPREQVLRNLLEERYEDVLKENEKTHRKLRASQDQLSIVSAKKHAYKTQSEKVEKELENLQKAFDAVQQDAQRIQAENEYWAGASKEAVEMMNEMRMNHITEVRLLQRGLQSRNDEGSKNKVNEMADLLDKLGKAIVQRDESMKEKTRLKAQLHQARQEIKTLQDERRKHINLSKKYQVQLGEMQRANSILMGESGGGGGGASPGGASQVSDLSDQEFEEELSNFERRYQVLDEGAKGLDHWVESLHRERGTLEKTKIEQQELILSLERNIKSYHALCEQKDGKHRDLETRFVRVQQEYARLQTQVAQRQQDIEYRIEAERRNFEVRIKKMQTEFEHASSTAMGYQTLNEKLQHELMKVHDAYTALEIGATMADPEKADAKKDSDSEDDGKPKIFFPSERSNEYDILSKVDMAPGQLAYFIRDVIADVVNRMAKRQGFGHLTVEQQFIPVSLSKMKTAAGGAITWTGSPSKVAELASFTRTGELLNMEVWLVSAEKLELRGHEISSNEKYALELPEELLSELDQDDPWNELFQMVGIKNGPPKEMVFPTLLGRKEVFIGPNDLEVILTIYQYDFIRFYLNCYEISTQRLADLVLNEQNVEESMIEAMQPLVKANRPEFVYEFMRKYLHLEEEEHEGVDEKILTLELRYDVDNPYIPGQS